MKLHFFSFTKHQYTYFEKLRQHLNVEAKNTFFPSFSLSFKSDIIDTTEILTVKYKEIDVKYPNVLHRSLYKQFLKIQVSWISNVVYKQLTLHKPDFIVVWNGKKFHQAITVETARSLQIPSIYFENGLLPNTTTMDFKGVNASNSLPRVASFYQNLIYSNKTLPQSLEIRAAKKEKKRFDNTLPKEYIFIPFQVAYDTQIIQHSLWIKDMFHFFEIIEWLSHKLETVFVIKEHPSDRVSDYRKLHEQVNDKIQFSTQNTQTLIENATAVITINSSVAMESLLFKKPVIVLGEAFFAIEGIVKVATSKEKILDILQNIKSWKIDEKLIENFLYYLYYDYLIPTNWRTPEAKHYKAIEKKLKEHQC